ncbi:MAG: hypothetical protein FJ316_04135 [SAR202 cluster bacterium]|nr:hypothetical protein [SAR202 cluster bacterium]
MLKFVRWLTVAAIVATLAAIMPGVVPASAATGTRLEARLAATSADPLASGKASFEQRPDRVRFSTQVEDVATAGPLSVKVNGSAIGTINLGAGLGDLNLDSRRGQTVPVMNAGDTVQVYNAANVLILSGTLQSR